MAKKRWLVIMVIIGCGFLAPMQPALARQAFSDSVHSGVASETGTSFSVETLACPPGMTLLTLDFEACQSIGEPLVAWSIASDRFTGERISDEATILGATTIWDDLPAGAYFIDLTAERLALGFGNYFIPSSNQVTRQDERTTRIYIDTSQVRGSIRAYVFPH